MLTVVSRQLIVFHFNWVDLLGDKLKTKWGGSSGNWEQTCGTPWKCMWMWDICLTREACNKCLEDLNKSHQVQGITWAETGRGRRTISKIEQRKAIWHSSATYGCSLLQDPSFHRPLVWNNMAILLFVLFFNKCNIESSSLMSEIMAFFIFNDDNVILIATTLLCQKRPWFSYDRGQLGQKASLEAILVPSYFKKKTKLNN